MTDGKFPNGLARAMKASGKGFTELGTLIGEPRQSVLRWARGQRKLKPEMAMRIAPHLNTDANALLMIPVPSEPGVRELGQVGAGGAIIAVEELPADTPEIEVIAGDPYGAARISGVSLGMFEGWYAIFSERQAYTDDLLGELCVVHTREGETLIKWLEKNGRKGVRLRSGDGTVHTERADIDWCARVIGLRPNRYK